MKPSYQRLRTGENGSVPPDTVFGLIEHPELVFRKCFVYVAYEPFLMQLPCVKLCVVKIKAGGIAVPQLVAGKACTVESALHIRNAAVIVVYTYAHAYLALPQAFFKAFHIAVQLFPQIRRVGDVHTEAVGAGAAGKTSTLADYLMETVPYDL